MRAQVGDPGTSLGENAYSRHEEKILSRRKRSTSRSNADDASPWPRSYAWLPHRYPALRGHAGTERCRQAHAPCLSAARILARLISGNETKPSRVSAGSSGCQSTPTEGIPSTLFRCPVRPASLRSRIAQARPSPERCPSRAWQASLCGKTRGNVHYTPLHAGVHMSHCGSKHPKSKPSSHRNEPIDGLAASGGLVLQRADEVLAGCGDARGFARRERRVLSPVLHC
jgi:hypothetical protein